MPTMQVSGPAPSPGPGGIPTKVLLIGGGALVVGFLVWKTSSGGGAAAARPATDGGTSVAGALTGLQQDAKVQYGDLTKTLQGLSTHLDTQAQQLSDAQQAGFQNVYSGAAWEAGNLNQILDAISRQIRGLPDPSGGVANPDYSVIGQPTMPGS